jgi:hypothetical protein
MRPTFYVTPRALQWLIFSPGRRAHELETSRARAIARAKVLARAVGGGEVIVARRDGSTEARDLREPPRDEVDAPFTRTA